MMNNYKVSYSGEALSDLREIYSYIAYELNFLFLKLLPLK